MGNTQFREHVIKEWKQEEDPNLRFFDDINPKDIFNTELTERSWKDLKFASSHEDSTDSFFAKDNALPRITRGDFHSQQEIHNLKESLLLSLFSQRYLERLINSESLENSQTIPSAGKDLHQIRSVQEQLVMLQRANIRLQRKSDIEGVLVFFCIL